jgi:hypothetical protein
MDVLPMIASTSGIASLLLAGAITSFPAGGPTTLLWTGNGDGVSVADAANWSGTPDGGSINLAAITEILVIDDAMATVGGPTGASTLNFTGDGGLVMHAGTLTRSGANQAIENGFLLMTGGTVKRQWISRCTVRLEGTGRIELSGGADPLPNGTIVDLGSMRAGIDFLNEVPGDVITEHLSKISINGSVAIVGKNVLLENFNGGLGCSLSILPDICPADLNGDLLVNGADLGMLLGAWGTASELADVNADGDVNGADLGLMLGSWGECPTGPELPDCGSPKHCELLYPDLP